MPERSRPAPVARRRGDCGMRGGSRESVAAPAGSVQERVPGRPCGSPVAASGDRVDEIPRRDRAETAVRAAPEGAQRTQGAPEASRPAPSSTAHVRGTCRAQRSTRQPAHDLAVPLLWGAMSAAMGEHARNGASTTGRRHGGTAARRRRERPTVYFRRVALYSVYRVTPGTGDHPRGALDPCALIRGGDPRDVWSGVVPRRPVAVHPCGVRRQLAVTMAITPRVPMGRLPRAAPPSGPANPEAVHAF